MSDNDAYGRPPTGPGHHLPGQYGDHGQYGQPGQPGQNSQQPPYRQVQPYAG